MHWAISTALMFRKSWCHCRCHCDSCDLRYLFFEWHLTCVEHFFLEQKYCGQFNIFKYLSTTLYLYLYRFANDCYCFVLTVHFLYKSRWSIWNRLHSIFEIVVLCFDFQVSDKNATCNCVRFLFGCWAKFGRFKFECKCCGCWRSWWIFE